MGVQRWIRDLDFLQANERLASQPTVNIEGLVGGYTGPGGKTVLPPLRMAAGHFGMGHGAGAHAPDEYYVIEASNPKVQGMAEAAVSYVEFLYALAG